MTVYVPPPTVAKFIKDRSMVTAIIGPFGPLSADTEFLTPNGWKRIDEYEKGDLVLQWWPDGRTEFVEPDDYIVTPQTEFLWFHNKHSLSMVVSANHRVPYYDHKGQFKVALACDVAKQKHIYVPAYDNKLQRQQKILLCPRKEHDIIPSPDGKQYCFSLPSSFFVARHNNTIFVTGNSGKSVGSIMKIVQIACSQEPDEKGIRRTRFAIIRNTLEELKKTTIKTFLEWLPDGLAGEWLKSDKTFWFGAVPGRGDTIKTYITLPDGTIPMCECIFLGLDRPDQVRSLLSLDLTGAWINEFREVPYEIFAGLIGRKGRYPQNPTWNGIIMDSNPFDEDSVWYTMFEENNDPEFVLYKQPSGLSPDAENTEHLPPNYYEDQVKAAEIAGRDDNWINIHIHGKYGRLFAGKPVFGKYYSDDKHYLKGQSVRPAAQYKIGIGIDFGRYSAAVIGQLIDDTWIIYNEFIMEDVSIIEFMEEFNSFLDNEYGSQAKYFVYGDPAGLQRSQIDNRTCFDIVRSFGYTIYPSIQGVQLRKEAVIAALRREDGFFLAEPCKELRKALQGKYRYRKLRTNEEKYDLKPEKNEASHVCFVAGTKISTPNGDRNIEELKVGDLVYTSKGIQPVINTGTRYVDNILELKFSNGVVIRCTDDHPFITHRGKVPAKDLLPSDRFNTIGERLCPHEEKRAVRLVEASHGEGAMVYNLTVGTDHEYYANGFLVSNCDAWQYLCTPFEQAAIVHKLKRKGFPVHDEEQRIIKLPEWSIYDK